MIRKGRTLIDPETHTEPVGDEEPLFSNLDLFLFSLIIGLVVYYFMSRKKPEPIPEFKNASGFYFLLKPVCHWAVSQMQSFYDK
uniref:Uncharacterized protein n=1 Tax=Oryzias sinensis TaxID=183150 RepID=A0A8C7X2B1_9TELE